MNSKNGTLQDLTLALETSGREGSVALGTGGTLLESRCFGSAMRHAAELMLAIDAMFRRHGLSPGDLARVCVSGGPGSFTGLRVAITTARMFALALGAEVVRVPTLQVIAQNAFDMNAVPRRVIVWLDAKRNRVYAGAFEREREGDVFEPVCDPCEADPAEFLARAFQSCRRGAQNPDDDTDESCVVVGDGVAVHARAVQEAGLVALPESLSRPRAETVLGLGVRRASIGRVDDPRSLVPIYIRRPEAEERWEQQHGPD